MVLLVAEDPMSNHWCFRGIAMEWYILNLLNFLMKMILSTHFSASIFFFTSASQSKMVRHFLCFQNLGMRYLAAFRRCRVFITFNRQFYFTFIFKLCSFLNGCFISVFYYLLYIFFFVLQINNKLMINNSNSTVSYRKRPHRQHSSAYLTLSDQSCQLSR